MAPVVKIEEVEITTPAAASTVVGDLPDEPVVPKEVNRGIGPADEEVKPRPRKRFGGVMCIDLVEDQMRSRLVAVFAALAAYLIVGSDFIRFSAPPQDETAAPAKAPG